MAKKQLRALALILAAFALGSVFLVACTRPGTASVSNSGSSGSASSSNNACASGTSVKTGTSSFEQSCITLKKGDTLTIAPDQSGYHILDYGQWNGTSAAPATPASAPALKDVTLTSSSISVGPFTTAGTYHIYCTVHQGMDLTVVVK